MELKGILVFAVIISLTASASIVNKVKSEDGSNEGIQQKFQETIGRWLNFFQANLQWFSSVMVEFMKYAIKTVYFLIGLAGFIMWSSGISRYTGKKLMIGAVLMAIVSEILL